MKFGFDVDDTLIDLRRHAFNLYNQKLGKDLSVAEFEAIERVEIHEPFGLTETEGKEMWNRSLEEIYFTSCPLYPKAAETLQELEREGHEIYYVTARPKEHCGRTKEWLAAQGFPVHDSRFFCGMDDHEKAEIIRELDLDFYVDDKPAVTRTLEGAGVRVIVKDQVYNRGEDLPRIIDWSEFKTLTKG
ncbi:5' nucleotidase, NT5C type [Indiicoccus explosivorum]|uniref:5' nucleotidase, NT5C type n=1 Tax=Indiicoccus explosivorum TaxID=1917864 RepID=UPI000B443AC2|nr:hypothetical protein [Indiicoccus explosivorum]